ncbi:ABC transporter ATP-binding protein [Phaeovulum sp.]|uniref:ABC transporter ATP-binding protein n=1 Tax=Phaeovulum sp. TaxID=2934796 RepID=UPI003569BB69
MSQSPPPSRLEVQGLARAFGARQVLRGISFEVAAGQVSCLLGPSGCGKTTALRIIAGVDAGDAGVIRVDGTPIAGPGVQLPPEQRGVGLMFQDFALFPHLTVAQNVAFGLHGARPEQARRVAELLERVHMQHHAQSYPHALSGGEQQRVALARALAPRPRILLMDEPFSGLDERLRDAIRDETLQLLKEEGAAVLLVTHEPHEAMRMADQILLMRAGEIVQRGAPYNIYNAPADREAAAFFSDLNILTGKVQGALIDTAFGAFLAPGHADGTKVEIAIRPQHLKLDFDRAGRGPAPTAAEGTAARGQVLRARFLGRESLVEFGMDFDGSVLMASVPGVFLPTPGTPMWLMIRRDRCFVFAAR